MAGITGQATAIASDFPVRMHHVGVVSVISKYAVTATISVSDAIEICRIPDGARVLSVSVTNNGDICDCKVNVGTKADHDMFIRSQTFQNRTVYSTCGLGDALDVTDAAANKFTILTATFSDAGSASGSAVGTLTFVVTYDCGNSRTDASQLTGGGLITHPLLFRGSLWIYLLLCWDTILVSLAPAIPVPRETKPLP